MLFRKLWRTMGLYKAQFISMIIMTSLGVGMFVGFNMEWVSIEENTASFFEASGYADYRISSAQGFSEDELDSVADIDGVDAAARYLSVNADVKEYSGDGVAMTVTENSDVSGFVLMEGEEYDEKSSDGIWLSQRYAEENGIETGDSLTFEYNGLEFGGEVKGLVKSGEYLICIRDETQLMPDFGSFGFAYISPEMYESVMGTDFYPQINVISDMEKGDFTDAVDEKLDSTPLILTKDETTSYYQASGEAEEGKTMGSVLPVLFLLIAILTMITTMHRLTVKEKTQIGTLKALGFKDRRILRHYTSYAAFIGVLGTAIGSALGYLIGWYIMNPNGAMGTYFDMPEWKLCFPWFCAVVLAGVFVLLTLIGMLSTKSMLKGTAADALRPYSPKKMKPMLIEKTRVFHVLSFGTRWNLRDVMRHKSRTAMSFIGVLGCMVIMVCAFGMRDTVDSFVNIYYEGSLNYSSKIYLADGVSDDDVSSLIEKYDADSSASVSVQADDKAASLDVYNIRGDKVRFPDEDENFAEIGDDGAYVCKRIADRLNLTEGDTFTVSPYGSDDEYELKVAGILRSISENIVVSEKYADSLGISYTVDSLYTDTEKSDIGSDSLIKSVQTKESIISSFDSFMDVMNTMIVLLAAAGIILGIVVLYNLGIMSYTERYREMATLKVVGFKDRKIGALLTEQNLWTSLAGIIFGIPLGIMTLSYLMAALASDYEMKLFIGPMTYVFSVALTLGMSLLVSFMVSRKNRKIDMVEALKGAE